MLDILEQAARVVREHDMPEDVITAGRAYNRAIESPRTGNGNGATALEWTAGIMSAIESRLAILERQIEDAPPEVARVLKSEMAGYRDLRVLVNCLVDRLKGDRENERSSG